MGPDNPIRPEDAVYCQAANPPANHHEPFYEDLYLTVDRSIHLAAIVLSVGSALAIAGAVYVFPELPVACAFSLVVIAVSALFNWRFGFAVAAAISGALFAIGQTTPEVLTPGTLAMALFLVWAGLPYAWLVSQPTRTALDWAWDSYVHAREKTEEVQIRQGELVRLSRSLGEAVYSLERANDELERARKAAEEARRLKAEFAASISHELRTPLNLIIGFSELMVMGPASRRDGPLPPSHRGDLEAIYRNACHLSSLVDDVLDLSKVEAHRMALHREQLRIGEVVREAEAAIKTMFSDRGLILEVQLPPDLPVLRADRSRVRQVLLNLLSNAVRFTPRGRVTVGATHGVGEVVIWVTDSGMGIPATDLPHVFDEFYQFGEHNWRRSTGLGLTISKRFVELHGGNMWVESVEGEGSTFYFTLPLSDNVVAVPARDEWETWVHQPSDTSTLRTVAILDDDPEVVRLFQSYLDQYHVIGITDPSRGGQLGGEPVHAVVASSPDRIEKLLSDPSALAYRSSLSHAPAVVCPLRTSRSISRDLGVRRLLTKPVTNEQVYEVLRELGGRIRDLLIVDDEPEMVRLLTRLVQSVGPYRVRAAYDGIQALLEMREWRPDALLLDLLMPGLDGYAVLNEMSRDERLRDVPVVLVTAKGVDETVTASELRISRADGLSVGEVMRCLATSLNVLMDPPYEHNDPARRARIGG